MHLFAVEYSLNSSVGYTRLLMLSLADQSGLPNCSFNGLCCLSLLELSSWWKTQSIWYTWHLHQCFREQENYHHFWAAFHPSGPIIVPLPTTLAYYTLHTPQVQHLKRSTAIIYLTFLTALLEHILLIL